MNPRTKAQPEPEPEPDPQELRDQITLLQVRIDALETSERLLRDEPDLEKEWIQVGVRVALLRAQEMALREALRKAVAGTTAKWLDNVATTIRERREEAGWTQETLARKMRDMGHPSWKRQTVGEVEKDKPDRRRVAVDELLTLAILLRTPLAHFLSPAGADVAFPFGSLAADELERLLLGTGPRWPVPDVPLMNLADAVSLRAGVLLDDMDEDVGQ